MFIRRTNTRSSTTGEAYFTYRLVEAVRVGKVVRQRTLLNLGTHFDLPQADWADLAGRIGEVLQGQAALLTVSPVVAAQAQRYAAQIIPSSGHSIGSRRWNLWPASPGRGSRRIPAMKPRRPRRSASRRWT
jgi:hypothetical protein